MLQKMTVVTQSLTKIEVGLKKKCCSYDDRLDSNKGRSREKLCLHNSRKDNSFESNNSKIEQFQKVVKQLSPDKEMALGLILMFSENFDDTFNSICSVADVEQLIAERTACANSQKAKNLTKDINS